jgi:hypothetical protein
MRNLFGEWQVFQPLKIATLPWQDTIHATAKQLKDQHMAFGLSATERNPRLIRRLVPGGPSLEKG